MATLGLEFLDIEIIKPSDKKTEERWDCDQCKLFYLTKQKLEEHKNKAHTSTIGLDVKCRYCGKGLTNKDGKECISNRKCETCEYRCNNCPQRFLRLSSLVNHKKNNFCAKKKKPAIPSKSPVNGVAPVKTIKTLLPRKRPPDRLDNEPATSPSKISKPVNNDSPCKKPKLQPSNVSSISLNNNTKTYKGPKKKSANDASKTLNPTTPKKNSTPFSKMNSNSTSPLMNNSVNYKPFSCHICGENFASGETLLEHIKTHGDAANSFKCKFCSEEFVSIYEMQFHLATCELAENEIENLQNSIPSLKIPLKEPSDANPVVRKRGRPKKLLDQDFIESFETVKKRRPKKNVEETPEEPKEIPKADKKIRIEKSPAKPKLSPTKRRSRATKEPTPPLPGSSPEPTAVVDCGDIPPVMEDNEDDFHLEYTEDDFHLEYTEDPLAVDGTNNTDTQTATDEKKIYACWVPRCSFKFKREKALICHMKNHELGLAQEDEHLKCYKCDIPFDDLHSLRLHMNECRGLKEESDDDFQGRKSTSKPKRQSAEKPSTSQPFHSVNPFRCNSCERVYSTEEKLKRHSETHKGSMIACHYCKDMFSAHYLLVEHCKQNHPGKSSYRCYNCKENFISELFLQIHMKEYHSGARNTIQSKGNQEEPKLASVVKNQVKALNTLKIKKTLSGPTDLKTSPGASYKLKIPKEVSFASISKCLTKVDALCCPVCFEDFGNKGVLHDHFRMNHIVEINSVFICEICEVEKPTAEMLLYHMEMHSRLALSVNRFSTVRQFIADESERNVKACPSSTIVTASASKCKNLDSTSNLHSETEFDDTTESSSLKNVVDNIVDFISGDLTGENQSECAVGHLKKSDLQTAKHESVDLKLRRKRRNKKTWTRKRAQFSFENVNSKLRKISTPTVHNVSLQDVNLSCEQEESGDANISKQKLGWALSKESENNEDTKSLALNCLDRMKNVFTSADSSLSNGKVPDIPQHDKHSKTSLNTCKNTSKSSSINDDENCLLQQNAAKSCSRSILDVSFKDKVKTSYERIKESKTEKDETESGKFESEKRIKENENKNCTSEEENSVTKKNKSMQNKNEEIVLPDNKVGEKIENSLKQYNKITNNENSSTTEICSKTLVAATNMSTIIDKTCLEEKNLNPDNLKTKNKQEDNVYSTKERANETYKNSVPQGDDNKIEETTSAIEEISSAIEEASIVTLKHNSTQEGIDIKKGLKPEENNRKNYETKQHSSSRTKAVLMCSGDEKENVSEKKTESFEKDCVENLPEGVENNSQDFQRTSNTTNKSNPVMKTENNGENSNKRNIEEIVNDNLDTLNSRHASDDEIPCTMCSLVFYDQDSYLDHIALHIVD